MEIKYVSLPKPVFSATVDTGSPSLKRGMALLRQQGQFVTAVLLTRVETAEQFVQFGVGFGKQLRRKHEDVTLVVVGVESVDFMCVRIVEQKHVVTVDVVNPMPDKKFIVIA